MLYWKKGSKKEGGIEMKRAFYVAMLLAVTISGSMETTAWAEEKPVEMIAFERQHAENLTEFNFMIAVPSGILENTLEIIFSKSK